MQEHSKNQGKEFKIK